MIIRPVGNIPSVVPGSSNGVAESTTSASCELASGTVILTGLLFWSASRPATYDIVSDDRVVFTSWPLFWAETVMFGVKRMRSCCLRKVSWQNNQAKGKMRHTGLALPPLDQC